MIPIKKIFKTFPEFFFQSKLAEDNVDIPLSGYLSNRHDSSKCINKINGVTNEQPDLRISEL